MNVERLDRTRVFFTAPLGGYAKGNAMATCGDVDLLS